MSSKLAALVQRPHAADAVEASGFAILPQSWPRLPVLARSHVSRPPVFTYAEAKDPP